MLVKFVVWFSRKEMRATANDCQPQTVGEQALLFVVTEMAMERGRAPAVHV
jgi:hypothetical protein